MFTNTTVPQLEEALAEVPFLDAHTHLVGGKLDCFSCTRASRVRHKAWSWLTILNEHHMGWAWVSLFAVCFADLYVRLCSMGMVQDPMFVTFANLFDVPEKVFGP